MLNTGVFLKTQNVSDRAPNGGPNVCICGGPPKFFSEFYLNIWSDAQHICVLGRIAGKTGQKRAKICNSLQIGLILGQKWKRKCLPHHLGGVSRGFWILFLDWGT